MKRMRKQIKVMSAIVLVLTLFFTTLCGYAYADSVESIDDSQVQTVSENNISESIDVTENEPSAESQEVETVSENETPEPSESENDATDSNISGSDISTNDSVSDNQTDISSGDLSENQITETQLEEETQSEEDNVNLQNIIMFNVMTTPATGSSIVVASEDIYHQHAGNSESGGGCYSAPVMRTVNGYKVGHHEYANAGTFVCPNCGSYQNSSNYYYTCTYCDYNSGSVDKADYCTSCGTTSWRQHPGDIGPGMGVTTEVHCTHETLDYYDTSCGKDETTVVATLEIRKSVSGNDAIATAVLATMDECITDVTFVWDEGSEGPSVIIPESGYYGVTVIYKDTGTERSKHLEITTGDVTCYDRIYGTSEYLSDTPEEWEEEIGTEVSGSLFGEDTTPNYYYEGYIYQSSTTETVSGRGTTIYRYFIPTRCILNSYTDDGSFLGSELSADTIEDIYFSISTTIPSYALGSASVKHPTSTMDVQMYWTDFDHNGLYEVDIIAARSIELYTDASYQFKGLTNCYKIWGMKDVSFENVENTVGMFDECDKLRSLETPLEVAESVAATLPSTTYRKWVEKTDYSSSYTTTYTKLPVSLDTSILIVNIPNEINSTYRIALPTTIGMTVETISANDSMQEKYIIKGSKIIEISYCMPENGRLLTVQTGFADETSKMVSANDMSYELNLTTYEITEDGGRELLEDNIAEYEQPRKNYDIQIKQIELQLCSNEMSTYPQAGQYSGSNIHFVIGLENLLY